MAQMITLHVFCPSKKVCVRHSSFRQEAAWGTEKSIRAHGDELSSAPHAGLPWVGEGTSLSISVLLHIPGLSLLALQMLTELRESSGRRPHCFKKLYYGHESKPGTEPRASCRQVTSLRLAQTSSFFQRALFHLVLTKALERRQAREEGCSLSETRQWVCPVSCGCTPGSLQVPACAARGPPVSLAVYW